ncbi:hypothetical protein [Ancylothrix sp. D3o]|nr:hypothetical protein [Ancylothrix sp. D3o]
MVQLKTEKFQVNKKLRYFTPNGELVATPEEAATLTQKATYKP